MDTVREGLRGGCAEASLGSLAQQRIQEPDDGLLEGWMGRCGEGTRRL